MALNITTKKTGDQLTAAEFNEVVGEINKKVDFIVGKGLSTNDFTTTEKSKLSGLPGDVYSRAEVDNKIAASSGNVVSDNEVQVGVFQIGGAAGVIDNPVYSRFSLLLSLPKTQNETREYLLSSDPLGCNLYFSIDSFVVSSGENIESEIFVSMYEITKIYVDDNYDTKIIVKCKETTTRDLVAHLNIRYIKQYAEKLEIDITCANVVDADAVTVEFPTLKYDKETLVSFTTDDANASSFCRVWAGVNGRPVSNMFYHANQLEAGDIPDSIVDMTLNTTLGYTDGCGNERRFTHGVAIWPYCQANGTIMMDSTNPVDPSSTNKYRFMTPYLQWPDLAVMLKYGCSMYYHNIGTELFGSDKNANNVIAGLKADNERAIERVGRGVKILARPDGNNVFIDAAAQSGQVLLSVAENTPAIDIFPFSINSLFKKVGSRFFPSSSGSVTEQDVVKNKFIEELAKVKEQRKWFHFCCHTATQDWVNLLVWFNDNYGKDGVDNIWFSTIDEVYEYYHTRGNSLIRKSASGNTLHLTVYLPKGQYFYYPDFTLLLSGGDITEVTTVNASDKVTGLFKVVRNGKLMLNVSANSRHLELAEEFTSKFETTGKAIDKADALYFIGFLRESLKQGFIDRLNVDPDNLSLLSISINNGATSTMNRTLSVEPSYNGTPTHYRIGETNDLNSVTWIVYSGGAISYTLSSGYGSKIVYLQLMNSKSESSIKQATIDYTEESTEVVLTGVEVSGGGSLQAGSSLQLSIVYIPMNTTQTGVRWESSNPAIASINASGLVTGITGGNVTITAISVVNSAIKAVLNLSVSSVVAGNAQFAIGGYDWSAYKVDKIFDEVAGIYITITNENNNTGIAGGSNNIYDANTGNLLVGWTRMSDDEKKAYYGVEVLDNWYSAPNFNADLSSLFATQYPYTYSSKYNMSVYPILGWHIPNGTYKINVLASTTQADSSTTGHIKINNVEQVLPTLSFQNNKTWMEFDNIVVNDGKLGIMMWADKSRRIGFNVIKIEKLS